MPICHCKKLRREAHHLTVDTETILCITLCPLIGASYLRVRWPYRIATSTVNEVFDESLKELDEMLPTIRFPTAQDECKASALQFQELQKMQLQGTLDVID